MAENDLQEPGKKSPVKWIILAVLLLALAGGGYFAYTQFVQPQSGQTTAGQDEGGASDAGGPGLTGEGVVTTLPTFLVNLADPLGRRYIKLTLDLEVRSQRAMERIKEHEAKIRDAIILLLSSKSYSDLAPLENKILLKNEIVERINQVMNESIVRRVYFTEMVIQ